MAISRITLDPTIRDLINQIQSKTKTASPSAAIALIVSRYARHLLETWELDPAKCMESSPAQYYPVSASSPPPRNNPEFQFSEPVEGL
jgi:hypothetical protein